MKFSDRPMAISKQLSANDVGETGGHQAGILVPKVGNVLTFFPQLRKEELNPRIHLFFFDAHGKRWEFAFIFYNNRMFGGTRNEYRLTRMMPFFSSNKLRSGDFVDLRRNDETGRLSVDFRRAVPSTRTSTGVLKLGSTWSEIKI